MELAVKWNRNRRFGIEYEFMDDRSRQAKMKQIVMAATQQRVEIRGYERTTDNNYWVVKTDSSASIELNTPISSGPTQLKAVTEVLKNLHENNFWFDSRCGMHVHLDVSDFTYDSIKGLVAWWMKCERFFVNQVPYHRRSNRYCQMITSIYNPTNSQIAGGYDINYLWEKVCDGRFALNVQLFSSRKTIEFRYGDMIFDPEVVKNRIRSLIWFVDLCKKLSTPSTLQWLHPEDVMKMMGLYGISSEKTVIKYSPSVQSMRKSLLENFISFAPSCYSKEVGECKTMLESIKSETTLASEE